MKFFKHFVDSHRGQSLQSLRRKNGMAAVGRWWTLVEICAEKMEKNKTEEFTEAHCQFTFSKPYLAASLGLANLKQTSTYLEALVMLGLCSVEHSQDAVVISMPKLLECMDRDSRRARTERATTAPKKKIKNKKKEIDKEYTPAFENFWKGYPRKEGKVDAFIAFQKNVTDEEQAIVSKAVANYTANLIRKKTEDTFIKLPTTFLNLGRWRDWLDPEHGKSESFAKPKSTSINDLVLPDMKPKETA